MQPPEHLSIESQAFWTAILEDFELESHHKKVLQAACEAWDRILEARTVIDQQGAFYRDRFDQPKEHPAAKAERDNRVIFVRLIRELGLDIDSPESPRPPAKY